MEVEGEQEKNNGLVFPLGCNYDTIKSVSFSKPGPFELRFEYD